MYLEPAQASNASLLGSWRYSTQTQPWNFAVSNLRSCYVVTAVCLYLSVTLSESFYTRGTSGLKFIISDIFRAVCKGCKRAFTGVLVLTHYIISPAFNDMFMCVRFVNVQLQGRGRDKSMRVGTGGPYVTRGYRRKGSYPRTNRPKSYRRKKYRG